MGSLRFNLPQVSNLRQVFVAELLSGRIFIMNRGQISPLWQVMSIAHLNLFFARFQPIPAPPFPVYAG